jgi:hypothetical protein
MTSAIQTPNTPSAPPIGKVLVPVFLIVFTDIMGFGLMILYPAVSRAKSLER